LVGVKEAVDDDAVQWGRLMRQSMALAAAPLLCGLIIVAQFLGLRLAASHRDGVEVSQ
jgi:hypothetical protein